MNIMIRDIYYGLLQGRYNVSDFGLNGATEVPFEIKHAKHCFDYLQQSIRCAGLMQIELPHGEHRTVFDGYWSDHQCKSWVSWQNSTIKPRD